MGTTPSVGQITLTNPDRMIEGMTSHRYKLVAQDDMTPKEALSLALMADYRSADEFGCFRMTPELFDELPSSVKRHLVRID